MDNANSKIIIYIVIIFFIVTSLLAIFQKKLEHLTTQSDEAAQNLYSIYNKNNTYVTNLVVTEDSTLKNATSENINTNVLKVGDKWSFSGIGDAQANDDWLRLLKTDASRDYYGGVAAGRLYDGRVGDLANMRNILQSGIDNTNARINRISGAKDGQRCLDGWDLTDFNAANPEDCASRCAALAPGTLCAAYRKNDGHCWCKNGLAVFPDANWISTFLPESPPPPPPGSCVVM